MLMRILKYLKRKRYARLPTRCSVKQMKDFLRVPPEPHIRLTGFAGKNIREILTAFPNCSVRFSHQSTNLYIEVKIKEAEGIKCLIFDHVVCTEALFFPNV